MNVLDRLLRDWRISKAVACIPDDVRVLDIGSHDGALFRSLGTRLRDGVGLDPDLPSDIVRPAYCLLRAAFPEGYEGEPGSFDAVTALAVIEHIPLDRQATFASAIGEVLREGGLVVITVPSPKVDRILDVAMKVRLLHGMEAGQHYGFDVERLVPLFRNAGFDPVRHDRFQLGLNNLFVFRKRGRS